LKASSTTLQEGEEVDKENTNFWTATGKI